MTYKDFIETYLKKSRCGKVAEFIELLATCNYKYDTIANLYDEGSIGFTIGDNNDKSILIYIKNYKNSWSISVDDTLHNISEKAYGTKKINILINKLYDIFTKPKKNVIIENLFFDIVVNYIKLTKSFHKLNDEMRMSFDNTAKLLEQVVDTIELEGDTLIDLFKIYKFFNERLNNPNNNVGFFFFEKLVIMNTICDKLLSYIGQVHYEEPNSNEMCKITAESNPICYAHVLPFYGGKCHRLHGHNGKLSITMEVSKDFYMKRPMMVSYGFLKGFLKYIDNIMDHTTLIHINNKNTNLKLDGINLEVELDVDNINMKLKDGYNLIPNIEKVPIGSAETTSEMTLVNYVIPLFKIFLVDFICKENIDHTDLTFFELTEPIRFEFTWGETDSTYCSIPFSF